jgi:hypothetical protein
MLLVLLDSFSSIRSLCKGTLSCVGSDLLDGNSTVVPIPVHVLVVVITYPHILVLVAELVLQSKNLDVLQPFTVAWI